MRWKERLDNEELAEGYAFRKSRVGGCKEQMFSCIDHEFMLELINQLQSKKD